MPYNKQCGALRQMTYEGRQFTAKCHKFIHHENHPNSKHHRHFDHVRKVGWDSETTHDTSGNN